MLENAYGTVALGQNKDGLSPLYESKDLFCTLAPRALLLLFAVICWSVRTMSPSNNSSGSSRMDGGVKIIRGVASQCRVEPRFVCKYLSWFGLLLWSPCPHHHFFGGRLRPSPISRGKIQLRLVRSPGRKLLTNKRFSPSTSLECL